MLNIQDWSNFCFLSCSRFLKWGSYPVISEKVNAAYPVHMYVENNTLQVTALTAFEPKDMTVVPIYSPEPGDWFVGAYLSYWDEKVHQKVCTNILLPLHNTQ